MAKKQKLFSTKTVTRIAIIPVGKLNKWKALELNEIATRLGSLRSDLWNEYGSLKAWGVSEYEIDKILRPFNKHYGLPAKLWEATLYDIIGDIHAVQASCIEKVLDALKIRYFQSTKKKTVAQHSLESRDWLNHPKLAQLVRKYWWRGHTKVANQIVVKAYDLQSDKKGVIWLKFGGLVSGKTIKVPTTLKEVVKCQLRLIKRGNYWEIHYTTDIPAAPKRSVGEVIGADKGYTEVYATSTNDGARFIGESFGKIQTLESDKRCAKGRKRNLIRSIANKAVLKGNSAKADRITRNNLGRVKWNNREQSFKGQIKTLVFTATIKLMHDAVKTVAVEDLTEQFSSKAKRARRTKRNMNTWCKGIVAQALEQVSSRVGCTVVNVNACYTSQLDSRYGILLGTRSGDKFIGFDGVVMQADTNAADNILARMGDDEIPRFLKHRVAKEILLERTRKFQDRVDPLFVWDAVFGAITGTDKPKTLEPKRFTFE